MLSSDLAAEGWPVPRGRGPGTAMVPVVSASARPSGPCHGPLPQLAPGALLVPHARATAAADFWPQQAAARGKERSARAKGMQVRICLKYICTFWSFFLPLATASVAK